MIKEVTVHVHLYIIFLAMIYYILHIWWRRSPCICIYIYHICGNDILSCTNYERGHRACALLKVLLPQPYYDVGHLRDHHYIRQPVSPQNKCHNHFGPNPKVFSQAMTRSRMKGAKCIKDSFESQSDQLSATGLTCHRQSIISSFKIASEKLNHLSLSWCTFLITLPRLRSAFYIKKSFSNIARGTTDPG